MPAPLDVDREAAKTLAIAIGVREAARQMGIPEDTMRQWSARGQWLKPAPQPPTVTPQPVTNVTKPGQAMANALEGMKQKSRVNLGKFVVNASKVASRSRKPLEDAQAVRHVAAVHAAIWPEQQTAGLTLNLLNVGVGMQ